MIRSLKISSRSPSTCFPIVSEHAQSHLFHKISNVILIFTQDYLEAGESKYVSLMMRHQTLYESNFDLFESLIANSDKVYLLFKI